MAKTEGAVVIDTQMNTKKIEADFETIDKKTKNMINKYNKSLDSIKRQDLALDKVKQKLSDIESGNIVPSSIKDMDVQLKKNNAELEKILKKYNELSSKKFTTSIEDKEIQRLKQAQIDLNQINSEIIEEMKFAKETSPEVQHLRQQINNMTSSLEETKKQTSDLGKEIEETLNQKSKFLGIKDGFEDIGNRVDKFKKRMTRLIGTVAVFNLIRNGLTNLRNSFVSLLKQNDSFNSSLNQIKASLMTAFAPIYNACLPAINTLMDSLSKLTGTIAVFVSGLFGTSLEDAKNQAKDLSKSLEDVGTSGEEASGGLASFDNLEVVGGANAQTGGSSSTGIDYSGDIQYSQKLLDILNNIKNFVVENSDYIIGFIGGVTGALIAMKLFGLDPIMGLGIGIIIAGIITLVQGIIDFIKDPSWDNFVTILNGLALVLTGVAIAMLACNAANPITWIMLAVAAVAAFVAIIIKYRDEIKAWLAKVWGWIKEKVINPIVNGFNTVKDAIINVMKKIKSTISNIWDSIWSTIRNVINKIIGGIESMINTVIKGLNKIIEPLTKVGNTILGAIGIKSFSFSTIPQVKLPRLATGTVIPPRSEFAAILGDQKRGVNIEAPLDTIVDAFNKTLDKRENVSGELVLNNATFIIRAGDVDLSKVVVKSMRIAEKNLGKPLLVN